MIHSHGPGGGVALAAVAAAAIAYEARTLWPARDGRSWPWWRTAFFLTGCAALVLALAPGALPYPAGDLRGHMLRHLLIGMFAPLCLVLGAPVTLLLRTLPAGHGRRLGRLLHIRPVRLLAHPATALLLSVGGLAVLYLTPLHRATVHDPTLQAMVELHFLLSGYLFAWVIAGPDPAPGRPSVPSRLVVLGVAVAAHAMLSQLMYAGVYVQVSAPLAQRLGAATLMYYGGDLAELLLAVALVSSWRPRTRSARRGLRRSTAVA